MLLKLQLNLLMDRCAELTSPDASPGLIVPLVPRQNLAAFLVDALKGHYRPYSGSQDRNKRFTQGPLGAISEPLELLNLTPADLSKLNDEFQKVLGYITRDLQDSLQDCLTSLPPGGLPDRIVAIAERLVRHLVATGWHSAHLHTFFASESALRLTAKATGIAEVVEQVLTRFRVGGELLRYVVYTPRLIGRGGEDWGFKSISWEDLPLGARKALGDHLSQELRIDPNSATAEHDAAYPQRYRRWQLEHESLTLSKYVRFEVDARDPHSASELFREKYVRMKSIIYASRKGTGSLSDKSLHYTHRNVGRSPVQLQDVSVLVRGSVDEAAADHEVTLTHLNQPAFPYQKLKNEFPRQRELMGLFFDRCPIFRQLAISYANALEAFANRDVDRIFRNLAVATELIFATDHFDEVNSSRLLRNEGAALLTLDWLRDQFQSLTFLTKARSPGRSEAREPLQIHLIILDDDNWNAYATRVNASELLKWRRERLMAILRRPIPEIDNLRARFEAELIMLWHARHQFAHRASVFRERYFVALLLNLFRIALDFRFSCYAIWLEWHAGTKIERGAGAPAWETYEEGFVDGWKGEFGERVSRIMPDFAQFRNGSSDMLKQLVLGAGYSGLGVHPRRTAPVRPLSVSCYGA